MIGRWALIGFALLLASCATQAGMSRYVIKQSEDGKYYWVLQAANGQPLATSETYEAREAAREGIAAARAIAPTAPVVETPGQ